MNSSDLLAAWRLEIDDNELPYLWSDAEGFAFMDDAQKEFCRKTEGIEDSRTASVCRIEIVAGTEWYAKSPLILKIRKCQRIGVGNQIAVVNIETAEKNGATFDGSSGLITALIDGATKGFFQANPIPIDTVSINLSVFRLPLVPITEAGGQTLEIDDQHAPALIMWMRYRAYAKHDADAFEPAKRDDYQTRFWTYCARARAEQERSRRQVGTVAYGGL